MTPEQNREVIVLLKEIRTSVGSIGTFLYMLAVAIILGFVLTMMEMNVRGPRAEIYNSKIESAHLMELRRISNACLYERRTR